MAQKRQRVGSGSSQEFLLERTTRMQFPDPAAILEPLRWVVVGAAAARMYMPERATNDLDILIRATDAEAARAKLKAAGAVYRSELTIGGSSWTLPDGFPLDVIEGHESWIETALDEAQTNRGPQGMPILSLPYLVLTKFEASRVQDLADMTRMLGQASEEQIDAVRAVFRQWLPDETEDLESLITLGQLEMS
jgi:hypothetical protein